MFEARDWFRALSDAVQSIRGTSATDDRSYRFRTHVPVLTYDEAEAPVQPAQPPRPAMAVPEHDMPALQSALDDDEVFMLPPPQNAIGVHSRASYRLAKTNFVPQSIVPEASPRPLVPPREASDASRPLTHKVSVDDIKHYVQPESWHKQRLEEAQAKIRKKSLISIAPPIVPRPVSPAYVNEPKPTDMTSATPVNVEPEPTEATPPPVPARFDQPVPGLFDDDVLYAGTPVQSELDNSEETEEVPKRPLYSEVHKDTSRLSGMSAVAVLAPNPYENEPNAAPTATFQAPHVYKNDAAAGIGINKPAVYKNDPITQSTAPVVDVAAPHVYGNDPISVVPDVTQSLVFYDVASPYAYQNAPAAGTVSADPPIVYKNLTQPSYVAVAPPVPYKRLTEAQDTEAPQGFSTQPSYDNSSHAPTVPPKRPPRATSHVDEDAPPSLPPRPVTATDAVEAAPPVPPKTSAIESPRAHAPPPPIPPKNRPDPRDQVPYTKLTSASGSLRPASDGDGQPPRPPKQMSSQSERTSIAHSDSPRATPDAIQPPSEPLPLPSNMLRTTSFSLSQRRTGPPLAPKPRQVNVTLDADVTSAPPRPATEYDAPRPVQRSNYETLQPSDEPQPRRRVQTNPFLDDDDDGLHKESMA